MEYKFDQRDGQYKLLDVNGHTWGYHSIGRRAGVDFPYMLFADLVGEPLRIQRSRPGVRWIRLITDVPTAVLEILKGRQNWLAYVRSICSFDVEFLFSNEDVLPGLAKLALLPYLAVSRRL